MTYICQSAKEITEQLSEMIHEILETSKMNITNEEKPTEINLPELLTNLCEPYKLIAAANEINFLSACHSILQSVYPFPYLKRQFLIFLQMQLHIQKAGS